MPENTPPSPQSSDSKGRNYSGISVELKRARSRAGISHSELHRLTGISRTVLIGYESGRTRPGAREIILICDALKISPNRLLYGREEPFSKQDHPWAGIIESDEKAAIRLAVLMKLLAPDERNAILTMIQSLIEARHGKAKVEEMSAVLTTLEDWMPHLMQQFGSSFEKALTPEMQAQFEADAKQRFAKFEKPPTAPKPKNKAKK